LPGHPAILQGTLPGAKHGLTLQIEEVDLGVEEGARFSMSNVASVVSPSDRREMWPDASPTQSTVQGFDALLGSDQGPPACLLTAAAAFRTPRSAKIVPAWLMRDCSAEFAVLMGIANVRGVAV
jgi:hypothetical protein